VTRHTSPLFLVTVSALLTGCGGAPGDADKATAGPAAQGPPAVPMAVASRADLVAQAKGVCARMEDRFAGLAKPTTPPTAKQLRAIINAWAVTVDEFQDLTPPPAEAARFKRMLHRFDDAIRAARALPDAGGEMTLAFVAAMADAGMKGGTIAHSYGLDECSLFPPAPAPGELERYLEEQMRKSGGTLGPGGLTNPPDERLEGRPPKPKQRP
jgi:hypothetical protein